MLLNPDGSTALNSPDAIADVIRSQPDTSAAYQWNKADLTKIREQAEKQLINSHLKPLQAPIGVSPILKCWMEIS
jgi:hypothetical protein